MHATRASRALDIGSQTPRQRRQPFSQFSTDDPDGPRIDISHAPGHFAAACKDALAADLESALAELVEFLEANDVELADLEAARGFEFIALQKAAVEALLVDDATRRRYASLARRVRTTFTSLLADPAAQQATHRVAGVRSLAAKLVSAPK